MKKRAAPIDPPGTARVSAAFVAAFARCQQHFGWAGAELDELKQWCRGDEQARWYIEQLAAALDDWYDPRAWPLDAFRRHVGLPSLAQAWQRHGQQQARQQAQQQQQQQRNQRRTHAFSEKHHRRASRL